MHKPSPATVMAFLALVFAMGGFAVAANDSATTSAVKKKVKACYSKKTGELRIKKAGKKCKRGEKKLAWNKRGVRGKPGARGPQGPKGETGATGLTGAQGPAGLSGGSGGGVTLGPGSVGTDHLADGSITAAKLAQNLLNDNLLGLVIAYGESVNDGLTATKSVYAECPAGTQLVGGGGGPTNGLFVPFNLNSLVTSYNGPTIGNDWFVSAHEALPFASDWQVTAFAFCIRD